MPPVREQRPVLHDLGRVEVCALRQALVHPLAHRRQDQVQAPDADEAAKVPRDDAGRADVQAADQVAVALCKQKQLFHHGHSTLEGTFTQTCTFKR